VSGPIPGNRYKLFTLDELLRAIRGRSSDCEVVVTGRRALQELIQGSAALQSCNGGDMACVRGPLDTLCQIRA